MHMVVPHLETIPGLGSLFPHTRFAQAAPLGHRDRASGGGHQARGLEEGHEGRGSCKGGVRHGVGCLQRLVTDLTPRCGGWLTIRTPITPKTLDRAMPEAESALKSPPAAPLTRLSEIRAELSELGAGPGHQSRFFRAWMGQRELRCGRARPEHHFPRKLLEAEPSLRARLDAILHPVSEHPGEDGSRRLLLALHDGQTVESVLLPREGVCVSTQVGCAVGCRFCMTGQDGLIRQLGSAEIVAQVIQARRLAPVRKVVFMGMGEPAHNLNAVLEAIDLLGQEGGLAHKQLVFSTVGDPRAFEALREARIKPALALSLHSTLAARRRDLLPRAPDLTPQALVEAADAYARLSGYPVQYQWTLLAGVNDGEDELQGLEKLLQGRFGMLNIIPFNEVPGSG